MEDLQADFNLDINGNAIPAWIPEGSDVTIRERQLTGPGGVPAGSVEVILFFNPETRVSTEYSINQLVDKGWIPDGTSISEYVSSLENNKQTIEQETGQVITKNNISQVKAQYPGPTLGTPGTGEAVTPNTDISELTNSLEFSSLPEDQQELVRNVFQVIAENDTDNAERLAAAFETAEKVSDPFFKQQIRIARDAIERGFVSIDQEEQFREKQLQTNLADLKQDLETRKEFIGLEEQAALKGIEREYTQTLKSTRQSLAARGMSSSSVREESEQLIEETTGDLRESTKRRFGAQMTEALRSGERGERDTQSELERLRELTKDKKLELFRGAEETLGTAGLGKLNINQNIDPLGDLVGDIPQAQAKDIISGATQLIF